MSWTNPEMQNLFETAARLHEAGTAVYPEADGSSGSFFQDRETLNLYPSEMFEYTIDNPLQLKAELSRMWEYQQAEYMNAFASVCIVAAFKYRAQEKSSPKQQEGISSFIYEF